jgi:hypothetical protein
MPRKNKASNKGVIKRGFTRKKKSRGKINANKTLVDGIQFKSSLEAFTYRKLKEANIQFEYEPESYTILEGFVYPEQTWESVGKRVDLENKELKKVLPITYTPDFVAKDRSWYIECKGFANERFPYVWKMFKKKMSSENIIPALFVPKNQKQVLFCIEQIKKTFNC